MSKFVVDCMSKNPVMVGPDYPAQLALGDAERCKVHHVLVTDGSSYGIASRRALRAAGQEPVRNAVRVGCSTVSDQATLDEAEARMDTSKTNCLPVLAWDGTLCGVITRGDIGRARAERVRDSGELMLAKGCATCGVTQGLQAQAGGVAFCKDCLAHTRPPQSSWEELYFTLGGQG